MIKETLVKEEEEEDKRGFTAKQLEDIYRLPERIGSRQTIYNAEERGDIPKAERVWRGQVQQREWSIDQLPAIGEKYGFLGNPKLRQHIITVWTQKGGTGKTTTVQTLGRAFALNGIKVLVIGLEIQPSITNLLLPIPKDISVVEAMKITQSRKGLYHLLYEDGAELSDVIYKTDIPTLDVIPEGDHLAKLERDISSELEREKVFRERLIPLLGNYDVIIFDNGSVYNQLVSNSLAAANTVITPVACNFGCYDVLDSNMKYLKSFQKKAGKGWRNFIFIPTLLEKNILSQDIYAAYRKDHQNIMSPCSIRRSIIGQEAAWNRLSILEHSPKSTLAKDYYELILWLWSKMNDSHESAIRTV